MSNSRRDFVVEQLKDFNSDIDKKNRHKKYCKMSNSPFVFYRGTAHIYWADFAQKKLLKKMGSKKTKIWVTGDMHAYNYGAFSDTKGQHVDYDLNDFDEGLIADYQLDVWRAAASLVLIARENGASKKSTERKLVETFADSYLTRIGKLCGNSKEKRAFHLEKHTKSPLKDFLKDVGKDSKEKSRKKMLDKWTNGKGKFDLKLSKLGKPTKNEDKMVRKAMDGTESPYCKMLKSEEFEFEKIKDNYFHILDVAKRLDAGTGSLGTDRFYVLIEGESKNPDDGRILDVKCQGRASAYPYLDKADKKLYKTYPNDAVRTVEAYRALAPEKDAYLGWVKLTKGCYSVRERSPKKDSYPAMVSELKGRKKLSLKDKGNFKSMCKQWGKILAVAHARADDEYKSNLIDYCFEKEVDKATKGKHKKFCKQVADIGLDYADQVKKDWGYFTDWFDVKS